MKHLIAGLVLAGALVAAPAEKKAEPAQAKDPVCGMTVETKSAEKAEYKGKTYYFCSKEEKATFQKSPEKFVKEEGSKKKS